MSQLNLQASPLTQAFHDLRRDLLHDDGPRISTMRNYRFAIVQYRPELEFALREQVQRLTADLTAAGWVVLSINLQQLVLDRVRGLGEENVQRLMDMERRLFANGPERGLNHLANKLAPIIEGPGGIAADCRRKIIEYADAHPEHKERILALIGRAGALYPFFRSSALLKHLDGQTQNIPVVLLYPGTRHGTTGLSFMDRLDPDHDYRPRIYP
jgi:hypothetical protein